MIEATTLCKLSAYLLTRPQLAICQQQKRFAFEWCRTKGGGCSQKGVGQLSNEGRSGRRERLDNWFNIGTPQPRIAGPSSNIKYYFLNQNFIGIILIIYAISRALRGSSSTQDRLVRSGGFKSYPPLTHTSSVDCMARVEAFDFGKILQDSQTIPGLSGDHRW